MSYSEIYEELCENYGKDEDAAEKDARSKWVETNESEDSGLLVNWTESDSQITEENGPAISAESVLVKSNISLISQNSRVPAELINSENSQLNLNADSINSVCDTIPEREIEKDILTENYNIYNGVDVANRLRRLSHSNLLVGEKPVSSFRRTLSHPVIHLDSGRLKLNPISISTEGNNATPPDHIEIERRIQSATMQSFKLKARSRSFSLHSDSLPTLMNCNCNGTMDMDIARNAARRTKPVLPPLNIVKAKSPDVLDNKCSQSARFLTSKSDNYEKELLNCSTGCLPSLNINDARKRNYLVGNLGSRGALLGAVELDRYFPSRNLRLLIATWNVHGKCPNESIDDLLLPEELEFVPDMYVVGIQEASPNRQAWEVKVQETIGPSHVLFHSLSFGSLHLAVFLRREIIWFISIAEEATFSTKLNSSINTKGAAAIQFLFFGTSFLFICSHFTAHDDKVNDRIQDYRRILNGLNLPQKNLLKSRKHKIDIFDKYDCVFWFGDLNFRLSQERSKVISRINSIIEQSEPNFDDLLRDDQLLKIMSSGEIFRGFSEGRINFMPTYKYDVGTNAFDTTEKMRIPSYTDRILYRSRKKNAATCVFYNSAQTICSSDHKPVYGLFEVGLRPGRDNIPLAAGSFQRDVYLEALTTRSRSLDLPMKIQSATCSSVCSIM